MGIGSFISNSRRILKLATKPSRKELWMSAKISVLAMFLVGLLSFGIQYLMLVVTAQWQ
ncbi:MAG: protein translocase SEC61 complex subunit gamma [Candidatus Thorarchaeota archaeon]|nr:protein translocase SEC61 complex subunit gamma [Candidatus Thorarchaeota archaeon]